MQHLFLLVGLPSLFWLFLLLLSVFIVGAGIFLMTKHRKFIRESVQALAQMIDELNELEYCTIDNLDDVVKIFTKQGQTLLQQVGDKMKSQSDRLYQGKWISEPATLLKTDRILTKAQYRMITSETSLQLLSLSIVATSVFLIFAISQSGDRSIALALSFIPLILGAIFSFLLYFQSAKGKQEISRSLNLLAETIQEKLPVFRELAGTAALIESFFQYDRQMSDSITTLSQTVEDLTHYRLAEYLASNVKEAMEKEVLPPLLDAVASLENTSRVIAERQEHGMEDLTQKFTGSLTRSLDQNLRPFYQELTGFTEEIHNSNQALDHALETMENYKAQSVEIQSKVNESLDKLAQSRIDWQDDMGKQTESLASLARSTESLSKLQQGSEENLASEIKALRKSGEDMQDALYRVTQGLHLESQQSAETVRELSDSSNKTLADMRQLSSLLVDQADYMLQQSQSLKASSDAIDEALQSSIQSFAGQMQVGVKQTLDEFDDGLAEISDRLSNTTSEIRDTVGQWASDVRWAQEYRYRNQRDDDLAVNEKQEELLRILDAKKSPKQDIPPARDNDTNVEGKEDDSLGYQ